MGQTANKLLLALCMEGRMVSMDQRRFWSRNYEKMMTKYTVKEADPESGRKTKLLETYKLSAVVELLAAMYAETVGAGQGD